MHRLFDFEVAMLLQFEYFFFVLFSYSPSASVFSDQDPTECQSFES